MEFTSKQIKIAKRLSYGANLFRRYFFRDALFSKQFDDGYKALLCFVKHYAYERQGAPTASYTKIAKRAIENQFNGSIKSVILTDAKETWKYYLEIAKKEYNNLGVNETHNPMKSDSGVLRVMANRNIINIASYVKGLIQNNQTKEAHRLLTSIRGVGTKIASLYLRDIAYLGKLPESRIKEQYYLQPVDTWIEQTLSIVFGNENPRVLREKQERIVDLCKAANVSPIAFNQGAWVLGSQISGDYKTFQKIAEGKDVKSIITEHIEEEKNYVSELERLLQNWAEL